MPKSEEVWAEIRATSEQLSELSRHLREIAAETCHAAQDQQERNALLHLELLQNLKKLADQVRDILWRELRSSSGETTPAESKNRAAELFTLLARISAAQQEGAPSRSFFEEIESTVDRTLNRAHNPDPESTETSGSKAA